MPRSRIRRKAAYSPPPTRSPANMPSPRWVAPTMVVLFTLGLAWLVVYYLAGSDVPGMSALGNWNLLVAGALVIAGFVVSTRWR